MTELHRFVTTLAEYVVSDNLEVPDNVRKAADLYAKECEKTNERLVSCDQLLKNHQRAEALRQAQLEPDVLKVYAELDFPNRELWEETALRTGLAVPPRLNAKLARRLNQAYAEAQSTEDLLRQHRLLALQRAPLQRRLEVLRLLSAAEPNNLGWSEDVQDFEAARFDEIRAAINDPTKANNWAIVRGLLDDLQAENWLTPPPLDVIAAVQERHDDMRRKQGERLLRLLNPQLQRMVSDGNLEGAMDLEAQAIKVVEDYGIPDKSPLVVPLRQTTDWIDAERKRRKLQKQYDQALDQLTRALEDGVAWSYVQHYYEVVMEYRKPIPRDVAERYQAKARFRTMMWILGGSATLVILLIVVAVILILKM
jgi:hypothetical protein